MTAATSPDLSLILAKLLLLDTNSENVFALPIGLVTASGVATGGWGLGPVMGFKILRTGSLLYRTYYQQVPSERSNVCKEKQERVCLS